MAGTCPALPAGLHGALQGWPGAVTPRVTRTAITDQNTHRNIGMVIPRGPEAVYVPENVNPAWGNRKMQIKCVPNPWSHSHLPGLDPAPSPAGTTFTPSHIPRQGSWNWIFLKVPSNPIHSTILGSLHRPIRGEVRPGRRGCNPRGLPTAPNPLISGSRSSGATSASLVPVPSRCCCSSGMGQPVGATTPIFQPWKKHPGIKHADGSPYPTG